MAFQFRARFEAQGHSWAPFFSDRGADLAAELLFRLRFCILVCVVFTLCDYLIIKISFPFLSLADAWH